MLCVGLENSFETIVNASVGLENIFETIGNVMHFPRTIAENRGDCCACPTATLRANRKHMF